MTWKMGNFSIFYSCKKFKNGRYFRMLGVELIIMLNKIFTTYGNIFAIMLSEKKLKEFDTWLMSTYLKIGSFMFHARIDVGCKLAAQ